MFDRTTWIALALSVAGLIGWQLYFTQHYPNNGQQTQQSVQSETPQQEQQTASSTAHDVSGTSRVTTATSQTINPARTQITKEEKKLYSPKATYQFTNDIGGIEKVTLFIHLGEQAKSIQLNQFGPTALGAMQDQQGHLLNGFTMLADPKTGKAQFERVSQDGLKIEKSFILPETIGSPEDYLVKLHLSFSNTSQHPIAIPSYRLSCGGAFPVHLRDNSIYTRFDWFSGGKMNGININWFAAGRVPLLGIETHPERPLYQMDNPEVSWVAVASQYFCTILSTSTKQNSSKNSGMSSSGVWAKKFDVEHPENIEGSEKSSLSGIEGGLVLDSKELQPGETITQEYQIYAGPKNYFSLKQLPAGEEHVMNFGTFPIISEALLWSMDFLRNILGNYAAAIIMLTLIIKIVLWPIQDKATTSMRRMQALSPRMNQLREKYKDNPTKMNEELMKLYKKYGINPFGGCLPMLIQIPIFFGFYSMLGSAIELRNSHFLWITDLSQPDTIAHFLGFPINLLPIIMAGTMLWQMGLSPKGGDPSQQKITYIMPVIFLSFCYNFASALALYWTTQNLFSIAQLYMTRNRPIPGLAELEAAPAERSKKKKRK